MGGDGFELLELFAVPGERHVIDLKSSPGCLARCPYCQRLACPLKIRRRLALVRPRQ